VSKITAYRLARLLGDWSGGPGTLAGRLSDALAELIGDNALPLGSDLPSERELSSALGTSRGTITAAYARLRDTGFVNSRRGSGHRILSSTHFMRLASRPHVKLREDPDARSHVLDMSSGALQPAPIVRDIVAGVQGRDLVRLVNDVGYFSAGFPHLRWEIARYYSELGLATHPDNVLVTNGAQQAIWLLATSLVHPGDAVVAEDPTYRGALEAFRYQKARLLSVVPGSSHRLDLRKLETFLARGPKVAYLFSEVSNPLGRTLATGERLKLAELLRRHRVFLIEDGSQNELHFDRKTPLTPLAELLDEDSVATVGTMSKLFWGGLRVGWIRAGRGLIKTLTAFKAASDLGNPVLDQALAVQMFAHITAARDYRRAELREHLDILTHELGKRALPWSWIRPDGGTALWTRLSGVNTVSLRQLAARRGVLLSAGPDFSPRDGHSEFLRIPFVRPPEAIRSALDLIEVIADGAADARE